MSQMPEPSANSASADAPDVRNGLIASLATYITWGGFPLLFKMVATVSPVIVICSRVIWSMVFVGMVVSGRGGLGELKAALRSKAAIRGILASTALLGGNWLVFIWAVANDYVLQVSFAYFITPLISVVLGVVLLSERLNRVQTVSVVIATIGIVVQAFGIGNLPFVSLWLAVSFGVYAFIRKTVPVGSIAGLLAETLILFPFAVGYMIYFFVTQGWGPYGDPWLFFWLVMTGPITSIGLIMFAYGARQLPLTTIGMIQYITPSIHFFLAIWLFGETINPIQLFSFGLIWLSVAVFTFDMIRRGSVRRRASVS